MKKHILLITLFAVISILSVRAQNPGKVGLSASVQTEDFGIMLPIWVAENIVIAPALSFAYAEDIGSDISIGIIPRVYFKKEKLSPYLGFKFGVAINAPKDDGSHYTDEKNSTDIIAGIAFGGEYFIDDNFSIGVEAQGNYTQSDDNSWRFGNPGGSNFNLGTMVSASIYF